MQLSLSHVPLVLTQHNLGNPLAILAQLEALAILQELQAATSATQVISAQMHP